MVGAAGPRSVVFACSKPCHYHQSEADDESEERHIGGRTVVASQRFAGICRGGWNDLGAFPIAGFSKAERVYGLFDEASGAVAG